MNKCKCVAHSENECSCYDVDWRSAREIALESQVAEQAAVIEKMREALEGLHRAACKQGLQDGYKTVVMAARAAIAIAITTNSAEILAKRDLYIRGAVICNVLQCYSPDDSADDWADKIRVLADEKERSNG